AARLRAGLVPRARLAADAVLGGAVRDGAGGGDGRARADRLRRQRRDPRGRRRQRDAVRAGRLGRARGHAGRRAARGRAGDAARAGARAAGALLQRRRGRAPARGVRRAARVVTADVVVVTWRGRDVLGSCLEHLAAQDEPHRTIVVDNASHDGTAELVRERFPHATFVELPENRGFGAGVNAGVA